MKGTLQVTDIGEVSGGITGGQAGAFAPHFFTNHVLTFLSDSVGINIATLQYFYTYS